MARLPMEQKQKKVVGTKQTIKAIEKGSATQVYVAKDAEQHVVRDLLEKCKIKEIPIIYVDTMIDLGKACGIDVGAASAAVIGD